ncbi:MAG: aminopeptidase N [Legionellales bacterium]|nr:aminopeptidase N [Legionellales bacterium]
MNQHAVAQKIYRQNYQPPAYSIDTVELTFHLDIPTTRVVSVMQIHRTDMGTVDTPLVLDGDGLQLIELQLDGQLLTESDYILEQQQLTISNLPTQFVLTVVTDIEPQANTQLSGLYVSNQMFCTQCEAHGFRRITYFIDRPDVMAVYTTHIIADKTRYPLLLANGNLIAQEQLTDQRHSATWHDPFKKPCYLFALVAGDLACLNDQFVTCSGRKVQLCLYVEPGKQAGATYAMAALKRAMRWDEQRFGREYDLDIFNIVAVSHFNMGAMENKSLNIFNDQYILAQPDTATDLDYQQIEAVVAHEYFHNWTGNRITCRDWFQLSLKEGLTVYREQEYSADQFGTDWQRIHDVQRLRDQQFPEDASPLAHPVRPNAYLEVNNFYTATVYEKGAEVIRMLATLVGKTGFRQGMDLYFKRHDGQAVTIEALVQAIADANQMDMEHFMLWYSQSGTPQVTVTSMFDAVQQQLVLEISQQCLATSGQATKRPLMIPIKLTLLNEQGQAYPLCLASDSDGRLVDDQVLIVHQTKQRIIFSQIKEPPAISLLRDFSAPVHLKFNRTDEELASLLKLETNGFAKWDVLQQLVNKHLLLLLADYQQQRQLTAPTILLETYQTVLADPQMAPELKASLLQLPSEEELANHCVEVDVIGLHAVREFLMTAIAKVVSDELLACYTTLSDKTFTEINPTVFGWRSLKNQCLRLLMRLSNQQVIEACWQQFCTANSMSDELTALQLLLNGQTKYAPAATEQFYRKWEHDELVLNKWFATQATVPAVETLTVVQQLLHHPKFTYHNPNRVRALLGAFFMRNPIAFHQQKGNGYIFLSEQLLIVDTINPQVAARLITPLTRFKRYPLKQQQLMLTQLQRLAKQPHLSNDLREMIQTSLDGQ